MKDWIITIAYVSAIVGIACVFEFWAFPFSSAKSTTTHKVAREEQKPAMESNYVYLDIARNNTYVGRIGIQLFPEIVPQTAYNFYELCRSKAYRYTPFHRVIKQFMVQGGDVVNRDGSNGRSIYGEYFNDENFELKHDTGMVSMANSGSNTNNSQFFIVTAPGHTVSHLDGKHVVFGKVTEGMDIVHGMEEDNEFYIVDCDVHKAAPAS